MRRKGSANSQFVQRIPADLKVRAVGLKLSIPVGEEVVSHTVSPKADAIRFSLRTSSASEAKTRNAQAGAYLETVWQALRTDAPVSLTHRQAVALGGELYRAWADDRKTSSLSATYMPDGSWLVEKDVQEEAFVWEAAVAGLCREDTSGELLEPLEPEQLESKLGPIADRLLLNKGIRKVDAPSRTMLLSAFRDALKDSFELRRRQAEGDYSPDPKATRFPEWTSTSAPPILNKEPQVSLKGLMDEWWAEARTAGRSRSTYESYRSAIYRLAAFVGHDDARRVTPKDVLEFKDHRLAAGVSAKTVGDSDVAALRSVFDWAMKNQKIETNPAANVRVMRPKLVRTRSKGFTEGEAKAILSHALQHKQGQESAPIFAAKRWVPWLCAYTGARVGEVVQLRKCDVRRDGETAIITITPEAGTVKDKEVREVVLHEHLIATGFLAFVDASKGDYLFLKAPSKGDIRGVWRSVKNRLREFVRQVVTDGGVAPNHGWRHLFKTRGREVGIADSVLDAICGHAPKSVGGSYGEVTLKAQRESFAMFPRFELS